jgi:hypothetical protein
MTIANDHVAMQSLTGEALTSPTSAAIHCRYVDRGGRVLVPCPVSRQWLPPRGASLSSCGVPVSPVPPLSAVLRRRYDFPSAHLRSLMDSFPQPTAYLRVRARRSAPGRSEDNFRARALGCPAAQTAVSSYVDANGISQVSRRSFPCLCSVPRPRSNRCTLAMSVTSMLPPLPIRRRLRR